MEKYCDTNLNYYIKIKLTEEGIIIYKKHYAKYNCEAPKLDIDDDGYVRFQIHDFMNIFGERLFMGATLPCETNCKIQVKDEWHYVKNGDLPRQDGHTCFSIDVLASNKKWVYYQFSNSKWFCGNKEVKVYAWKEIVLPELPKFEVEK